MARKTFLNEGALSQRRKVVFDTETTGHYGTTKDPRIVSISAYEILDGVMTGKGVNYIVNPGVSVGSSADVHKMSDEYLQQHGKLFAEVAGDLLKFVGDSPMVAHNAAFDSKVLNRELRAAGHRALPTTRFVDTLSMERMANPGYGKAGMPGNKLSEVAQRYGAEVDSSSFHGSNYDARILGSIYSKLEANFLSKFPMRHNQTYANASSPSVAPYGQFNPVGIANAQEPEGNIHEWYVNTVRSLKKHLGAGNFALEPTNRGYEHILRYNQGGRQAYEHILPNPFLGADRFTIQNRELIPGEYDEDRYDTLGRIVGEGARNGGAAMHEMLAEHPQFPSLRPGPHGGSFQGGAMTSSNIVYTGERRQLAKENRLKLGATFQWLEDRLLRYPKMLFQGKAMNQSGVYVPDATKLIDAIPGISMDSEGNLTGPRVAKGNEGIRMETNSEATATFKVFGPNASRDQTRLAYLPITFNPSYKTGHGSMLMTKDFAREHTLEYTMHRHHPLGWNSLDNIELLQPGSTGEGGVIPIARDGKLDINIGYRGMKGYKLTENYVNMPYNEQTWRKLSAQFPERMARLSAKHRELLEAGIEDKWDRSTQKSGYIEAVSAANNLLADTQFRIAGGSRGYSHTDTSHAAEPVLTVHAQLEAPIFNAVAPSGGPGFIKATLAIINKRKWGIGKDVEGAIIGDFESVKGIEGIALSSLAAFKAKGYDPVKFIAEKGMELVGYSLAPDDMINGTPWYDQSRPEVVETAMAFGGWLFGDEGREWAHGSGMAKNVKMKPREIAASELHRFEDIENLKVQDIGGEKVRISAPKVEEWKLAASDVALRFATRPGSESPANMPMSMALRYAYDRDPAVVQDMIDKGFAANEQHYSGIRSFLNVAPGEYESQEIANIETIRGRAAQIEAEATGRDAPDAPRTGFMIDAIEDLHKNPYSDMMLRTSVQGLESIRLLSPSALRKIETQNATHEERSAVANAMLRLTQVASNPWEDRKAWEEDVRAKHSDYQRLLSEHMVDSQMGRKTVIPYEIPNSKTYMSVADPTLLPGETLLSDLPEDRAEMNRRGTVVEDWEDHLQAGNPTYTAATQNEDQDKDTKFGFVAPDNTRVTGRYPLDNPKSIQFGYAPGDERNLQRVRLSEAAEAAGYTGSDYDEIMQMPTAQAYSKLAKNSGYGKDEFAHINKAMDLYEAARDANTGKALEDASKKSSSVSTLKDWARISFLKATGQVNMGVVHNSVQTMLAGLEQSELMSGREINEMATQFGLLHRQAIDKTGDNPETASRFYSMLTTNYYGGKSVSGYMTTDKMKGMGVFRDIVTGMMRNMAANDSDPSVLLPAMRTSRSPEQERRLKDSISWMQSLDRKNLPADFTQQVYERMYGKKRTQDELWESAKGSPMHVFARAMAINKSVERLADPEWLSERGFTKENFLADIKGFIQNNPDAGKMAQGIAAYMQLNANDNYSMVQGMLPGAGIMSAVGNLPGYLGQRLRKLLPFHQNYAQSTELEQTYNQAMTSAPSMSLDPKVNPHGVTREEDMAMSKAVAAEQASMQRLSDSGLLDQLREEEKQAVHNEGSPTLNSLNEVPEVDFDGKTTVDYPVPSAITHSKDPKRLRVGEKLALARRIADGQANLEDHDLTPEDRNRVSTMSKEISHAQSEVNLTEEERYENSIDILSKKENEDVYVPHKEGESEELRKAIVSHNEDAASKIVQGEGALSQHRERLAKNADDLRNGKKPGGDRRRSKDYVSRILGGEDEDTVYSEIADSNSLTNVVKKEVAIRRKVAAGGSGDKPPTDKPPVANTLPPEPEKGGSSGNSGQSKPVPPDSSSSSSPVPPEARRPLPVDQATRQANMDERTQSRLSDSTRAKMETARAAIEDVRASMAEDDIPIGDVAQSADALSMFQSFVGQQVDAGRLPEGDLFRKDSYTIKRRKGGYSLFAHTKQIPGSDGVDPMDVLYERFTKLSDPIEKLSDRLEKLNEAMKETPENVEEIAKGFSELQRDVKAVRKGMGGINPRDLSAPVGDEDRMKDMQGIYDNLRRLSNDADNGAAIAGVKAGEPSGPSTMWERLFGGKGRQGLFSSPDSLMSNIGMSNVGWLLFASQRVGNMMFGGIEEDINIYKDAQANFASAEQSQHGGYPSSGIYTASNQRSFATSQSQYTAGKNLAWTQSWGQELLGDVLSQEQMGLVETGAEGVKGALGAPLELALRGYIGLKMLNSVRNIPKLINTIRSVGAAGGAAEAAAGGVGGAIASAIPIIAGTAAAGVAGMGAKSLVNFSAAQSLEAQGMDSETAARETDAPWWAPIGYGYVKGMLGAESWEMRAQQFDAHGMEPVGGFMRGVGNFLYGDVQTTTHLPVSNQTNTSSIPGTWKTMSRDLKLNRAEELAVSMLNSPPQFETIPEFADFLGKAGPFKNVEESSAFISNTFKTYGMTLDDVNNWKQNPGAKNLIVTAAMSSAAMNLNASGMSSYMAEIAPYATEHRLGSQQAWQDIADFMPLPAADKIAIATGTQAMSGKMKQFGLTGSQRNEFMKVMGNIDNEAVRSEVADIMFPSDELSYNKHLAAFGGTYMGKAASATMDLQTYLPANFEALHQNQLAQFGLQKQQYEWNYNWQLSEAERNMGWSRKFMDFETQNAQRGYNQSVQSMDMSRSQEQRQFGMQMQERGLSRQIMMQNYLWQEQDMNINRERIDIQRGWQDEDFAYGRERAGLQFSWSQEDYNRNIRLATGRQKREMIRGREREQTLFGMEDEQSQKEQDRRSEQRKWEDEDFERQKSHFEESKKLQIELFDMQTGHMAESHQMQMDQMDMRRRHMDEDFEADTIQRDERRAKMEEDHQYWLDYQAQQKVFWEANYELEVARYNLTVEHQRAVGLMYKNMDSFANTLMPEFNKQLELAARTMGVKANLVTSIGDELTMNIGFLNALAAAVGRLISRTTANP